MTPCAIYNVFDGEEHLEKSIKLIRNDCEWVIAMVQVTSNHGNKYRGGLDEVVRLHDEGLIDDYQIYKPNLAKAPGENETIKRNRGLNIARFLGASHYIMIDCDEYWDGLPKEVNCAHRMYTYFKEPTLMLDPPEAYYVPGLISLTPESRVGSFMCGFYCDPTRKPNIKLNEGRQWMHHFSYVRKNMTRKIENSSAKVHIDRKKWMLLEDLAAAKDGYYSKFYQKRLKLVENFFNVE